MKEASQVEPQFKARGENGMQKHINLSLTALFLTLVPALHSQDQKAEIQQRLASQFTLTKTTADRSDIVTPGSILTLKKDGVIMFTLDARVPAITTYKDGKLAMGFGDAMAITMALGSNQTASTVPQRKFVAGEKFWITASSVTDKHVMLVVYSDLINNVRYYGQIKFPFPKHSIPSVDDVMKTIAEVLDVQPPDNSPPSDTSTGDQTPPDTGAVTPKTIALGQTKDEVIAALGQPQKVVNLGTKEIYIYSDMKVTFLNGKVADVQ
jgi:hypothetical protein